MRRVLKNRLRARVPEARFYGVVHCSSLNAANGVYAQLQKRLDQTLWLAFQSLRSADFSVFVEIFVGQFFCSGDGGATAGHVFGFVEQAHGTDSN